MDFKQILKEQFKDLITEETLSTIHEAFEKAVNDKADQKAQLQVEASLLKVDDDHTQKLEKLVEAIDEDHSAKLQKLVEAIDFDHSQKLNKVLTKIDEDHTQKLQHIVEKYENILNEEAKTFQERIVEEVSNYMDLYLEKTVPTNQINEAVENIKAQKIVNQIRQLVGINEEFVNGEIKEALVDGKKTIDSLKKELNEAIEVNTELNHKFNQVQSTLLLEQKTKDLPESAKGYVTKLLKGKSTEYILENYQYVVEMFDKEITEQEENARERVQRRIVEAVDVPQTENLLEEEISVAPVKVEAGVSGYLNEMKKLDGSRLNLKH
jgi:hypothetical protein